MMKWQVKPKQTLTVDLTQKYELSPLTASLLALRGIKTDDQLDFWFHATEADLADPALMHDLDKAVARINQAIDAGEKITIYGDYDADGITATTIMVETLGILGANVDYFIPNRFKDGYGPNLACYQALVANGTQLIITVDNGVTGVNEVAYAKVHGVDTIITDHHTFQETLPDAYAIVHCNYPGQKYPFDDYCGAGVAYTICRQLMQDPMPELLELAMIGTIGDMVRTNGEGHIIVKRGLEVLNQTERVGLRALIKQAGLRLGQITETDIGFSIAPRLNAVGRLADANLAVKLLLTDDENEAAALAEQVEELNNQRKTLTTTVYQACLDQIATNHWQKQAALVLYDPDFHEGVLGLVANKVVEQYHKPTIVLTKGTNGEAKGSGRSIPSVNLFDSLNPLKTSLLTKFGGHDFACGLSLPLAKIPTLRQAFSTHLAKQTAPDTTYYDLELPTGKLSPQTLTDINQVGPFGTGNPQPLFAASEPTISHFFKIGRDKSHVKLQIQGLDVIGFNKPFLHESLLPFIDKVVVQLSLNHYQKKVALQGIITGLEFGAPVVINAAPPRVVDLRHEHYVMGFADKYLLFDTKNYGTASQQYGLADDQLAMVQDYHDTGEQLVLLDAPRNLTEFKQALSLDYQQLYLRFLLDQLPVKQLPSTPAFASVLKYIYAHPALSPADYAQVAPFLKIPYCDLLFILRVLFELKFVALTNGKITGIHSPVKRPLTASRYLRGTAVTLKFMQQLRTMPSQQLLEYVNHFTK